MSEAWPSSVPNRLGKTAEGSSPPSDVSVDLHLSINHLYPSLPCHQSGPHQPPLSSSTLTVSLPPTHLSSGQFPTFCTHSVYFSNRLTALLACFTIINQTKPTLLLTCRIGCTPPLRHTSHSLTTIDHHVLVYRCRFLTRWRRWKRWTIDSSTSAASWRNVSKLETGILGSRTGTPPSTCESFHPPYTDIRWQSMGYQMKKEMKIKLTFIYWEIICESLQRTTANVSRARSTLVFPRRRRQLFHVIHQVSTIS